MKKLLFLLCIPVACLAQSPLKTSELNIFKNGTYFIVKEGNVAAPEGKLTLEAPTSPLLGTYWFATSKDYKITHIDFDTDTLHKTSQAKNLLDLTAANTGKKIKISYAGGKDELKTASGMLLEFIKESAVLKLKTVEGKTLYINGHSLLDLLVEETPSEQFQKDTLSRFARIYLSKPISNTPMKLSYMHTGMHWFPSYNIRLLNNKQLQLELNALVENYSEPIANAELTLTVGSPQFMFGKDTDPLALDYFTGGEMYGSGSGSGAGVDNGTYQTFAFANTRSAKATSDSESYEVDYSYSTSGEKTNDLYMYKLGKISLAKNVKTSLPIFAATVSYEDIYEVKLVDYIRYAENRSVTNDPDKRFDVFHSLKLTNSSGNPLTTAPVFVQDEKLQPLAQDQVNYTPVNGKVTVQLAKSPDVVVKNNEEEVLKSDKTQKINGTVYNKVTIKGSISIENLQSKEINLNTSKYLSGTITETSDNGKVVRSVRYSGVNPASEASWEVKLAAGEKKLITYMYDVMVSF